MFQRLRELFCKHKDQEEFKVHGARHRVCNDCGRVQKWYRIDLDYWECVGHHSRPAFEAEIKKPASG